MFLKIITNVKAKHSTPVTPLTPAPQEKKTQSPPRNENYCPNKRENTGAAREPELSCILEWRPLL